MAPRPRELPSTVLTPQNPPPLKKQSVSLPGTLNGQVLQSSYEAKVLKQPIRLAFRTTKLGARDTEPYRDICEEFICFTPFPIDLGPSFPFKVPQRSRVTDD